MPNKGKILLSLDHTKLILKRFALELIEKHQSFDDTAIIGLQPRGIELANALRLEIENLIGRSIKFGELDHTFFRDDIGRGEIHIPKPSKINFSTESLNIIIVDDVLFTGRSVRSAIDAVMSFGRPKRIELLVLIERLFERELPIKPDYYGVLVDSRNTNNYVRVEWKTSNEVQVWLLENKDHE
jgi:pyrimidine operon attenuation protein/uracil phosphoribosyltransferase